MAVRHISYDEFVRDPAGVLNRVIEDNETVVIEKENGAGAVVKPSGAVKSRRKRRPKTGADREAFLASAGGWKDVDTDKLIADIYESRSISYRPPVEL
jgi:hypothetical protein